MRDQALTPVGTEAWPSDGPTAPDCRVSNEGLRALLEEKANFLMKTAGIRTFAEAMEIASANADVPKDLWAAPMPARAVAEVETEAGHLRAGVLIAGAVLGAALGLIFLCCG
jgi:hypothetical protein